MTEWFTSLSDDIRAIHTEMVFNVRWEKIVGYHAIGKRIVTDPDYQKHAKGNKGSVQALARKSGIGERNLYYAIKFYKMYPDVSNLPEGKNISWNKIITKYLPDDNPPSIAWFERWYSIRQILERFVNKYNNNIDDILQALEDFAKELRR